MQYDTESIIFYSLLALIAIVCIYGMHKVSQAIPLDYSKRTYSYKRVLRGGLFGLLASLLSFLMIDIFFKSHELALTVGVIFLCFTFVYIVWGFHFERWEKIRGARKED